MTLPSRRLLGYAATVAVCSLFALLIGWTSFGNSVSLYVQDFLTRSRLQPTPANHAVILAIDERTLGNFGGERQLRSIITRALTALHEASPRGVAIDVVLADKLEPMGDLALADALHALPNVVLASGLMQDRPGWDDPRPEFQGGSVTLGHVHAQLDDDGICRRYPLEKVAGRDRRWALAAEAYRRATGGGVVHESRADVQIGPEVIPAPVSSGRTMPLRYLVSPETGLSAIPRVSVLQLLNDPAAKQKIAGKMVFLGLTALTATTADRLSTPFDYMPGVDIQAQAYETIAHGDFLRVVSPLETLLICLVVAAVMGVVFWQFAGWPAYAAGAAALLIAHLLPAVLYRSHVLLPAAPLLFAAWATFIGAASYQLLRTRRELADAEAQRTRYVQAIHFVTHEMRTPLTAIQGSSELMGRYNLNEDKRKEMAQMINAESKRLGRLIQMFLDVERLSAGEMEIKTEPFSLGQVLETCLQRVRPLAARKQIEIESGEVAVVNLRGDRELMEYAIYNLLTNAVKYSPPETIVRVEDAMQGRFVHLSVRDQGMGMTDKEVRNIFKKFYRTKSAEASGEVGTGIGLSIVEQIVSHHGGRIEVTSTPGKGSCFTLVLPQAATP